MGVWLPPDSSPSLRKQFHIVHDDIDWTDVDDEPTDNHSVDVSCSPASQKSESITPSNTPYMCGPPPVSKLNTSYRKQSPKRRVKLATKFPCRTRRGMSCAIDTAWHKRGFDSLTGHTFFMSKSKYGKKVLKTVVKHRQCGVCSWWRRNKPGQKVRNHQCVRNHTGSARSMEAASGVEGVRELQEEGVTIEYIEGDGDNTLISKLKEDLKLNMRKRFDRNHIVKNVGKRLWKLHNDKVVKLSKSVILHLEKCLKYAFSKNQGNLDGMKSNLKAIIPHQFGEHSLCETRFCGYI